MSEQAIVVPGESISGGKNGCAKALQAPGCIEEVSGGRRESEGRSGGDRDKEDMGGDTEVHVGW